MGKSIRSKRKKRLRTLKRELVADHYDKKDAAKFAALEAAAAAPKIELPQRRRDMDVEPVARGRSPTRTAPSDVVVDNPGVAPTAMEVDAGRSRSPSAVRGKSKIRGGMWKKRGKSKAKVNREKKRKRKMQF